MLSQACVKNSVHGVWCLVVYTPPPADTHSLGRHPLGRHPPPQDGHCSGRYASYWNAFLLIFTGRNEVLAKVIFSQACVILSMGRCLGRFSNFSGGVLQFLRGFSNFSGGVLQFFGEGVVLQFGGGISNFSGVSNFFGGVSPIFLGGVSTGIRSTFGRYASYWNAFLSKIFFSINFFFTF